MGQYDAFIGALIHIQKIQAEKDAWYAQTGMHLSLEGIRIVTSAALPVKQGEPYKQTESHRIVTWRELEEARYPLVSLTEAIDFTRKAALERLAKLKNAG